MSFSINGLFYKLFIDPLISGIRQSIMVMVRPGESVVEIACGTGALATALARSAGHVTGIDLSSDMITTARRAAFRRGIRNLSFDMLDATDLSSFRDSQFDVAVTTMSLHQFEPAVALQVLSEMKRIAGRVIIADYNYPLVPGPAKYIALGIERLAGGDHYRNFRLYMQRGGISTLTAEAMLQIKYTEVRGNGVFIVAECK